MVNTTTNAVLDEGKLADATSVVLGAAATAAADKLDGIGANAGKVDLNGQILEVTDYTTENLKDLQGTGTVNVTTKNGAVLDDTKLTHATAIEIGAGTATLDATTADEAAFAAKTTVAAGAQLTVNNYVNADLSSLNVGAIAEENTFTLSGEFAAGDVIELALSDGATTETVSYTVLAEDIDGTDGADSDATRNAIAAKIVAEFGVDSATHFTAAAAGAVVTLTGDVAGTNYTVAETVTSTSGVGTLAETTSASSGAVVVNTTTNAVLDEDKLADATSVVLGVAASSVAVPAPISIESALASSASFSTAPSAVTTSRVPAPFVLSSKPLRFSFV